MWRIISAWDSAKLKLREEYRSCLLLWGGYQMNTRNKNITPPYYLGLTHRDMQRWVSSWVCWVQGYVSSCTVCSENKEWESLLAENLPYINSCKKYGSGYVGPFVLVNFLECSCLKQKQLGRRVNNHLKGYHSPTPTPKWLSLKVSDEWLTLGSTKPCKGIAKWMKIPRVSLASAKQEPETYKSGQPSCSVQCLCRQVTGDRTAELWPVSKSFQMPMTFVHSSREFYVLTGRII